MRRLARLNLAERGAAATDPAAAAVLAEVDRPPMEVMAEHVRVAATG